MPLGRGKYTNQIRSQRKGMQRAASPDTFVASPMSLVANIAQAPPSARAVHTLLSAQGPPSPTPSHCTISSTANLRRTAQAIYQSRKLH